MYIAGSGTPYWYEWEVGLLECLKMMTDTTIQSVVLQSVDFQSLDDVVVNYIDGSIINIQVKHSDVGDSFTYSTLTSGDHPMLEKWAKEWQQSKNKYSIREIRIVTNRSWGSKGSGNKCSFSNFVNKVFPKLQLDYAYQSNKNNETAACDWFKNQIGYLGNDAYDFIKTLNFCHEEDLPGVDIKIRKYVSQILGTNRKESIDASVNSLLAKLNEWSTSKRERQEIYREDVYNALCISSVNIPPYELYPEKPIFPSREVFAEKFLKCIQSSDKKMFFLQGLPGSGKTNFVSYLAQLENSIVDFRFYTYLPVNKELPSFSDDEGYYTGDFLWHSILTQLKKYFEKHNMLYKLNFPLVYNYLSVTEMKEIALKYLQEYAKLMGRTCYLFIDGLDHAARSRNVRHSFLSQLPLPNEINGDVKIVLVGQPINDKYPHQLINNDRVEYISLPTLEEPDIIMLLSKEHIEVPKIDTTVLAKSIIDVVGNNALNVLFAIYEVKRMQAAYSFDSIIRCLQERKLNCQIDRYYDWIVSSITDGGALLLKIKIIFAFASQKIHVQHVSDMCGATLEDVVIILNQLYPLIVCESDQFYVFHNDVRLFLKESMLTNSNYDTLALSIYNKVIESNSLSRYKYDILFDMTLELRNKEVVFELFSPEYIIESVQYKVSVNNLLKQFYTLSQLISRSETLDNIDKISFSASTISQFINNVQYNEKEDLFYDERTKCTKTESEKYVLSVEEKMKVIVNDIYSLLKKSYFDRAKCVFEEYLNTKTLDEFLSGATDRLDREYTERCGYICRFMAPDILRQYSDIESNNYLNFVKGWLAASSDFVSIGELKNTFTFKSYRAKDLNNYTANICNDKKLDAEVFDLLCKMYLGGNNKPISALIDLCVNGIFYSHDVSELQTVILSRQNEILESNEFEDRAQRIFYYIKSYFCLFSWFRKIDEIPQLYIDILENNSVTPGERGYPVAISQMELTNKVIKDFFESNETYDDQIGKIYETVYFVQKNGSGASFDCNAHQVTRFLLKVIYFTHCNKKSIFEIIDNIKYIFTCKDAKYVSELSQLFYDANAKEDFLDIVEHWCGSNGILWNRAYPDVEYLGMNMVGLLNQFGLKTEAQRIEKCILFKLFGYVDHKDYSLNGMLECYRLLPLSEDKLLEEGMRLLTISDQARSIGDNRLAGEINDYLFETAITLGVKYVSALFELKNNPNDFYNWRNCFLDAYFERLSTERFPDSELVALYAIVNAWIIDDIESKVKYGNSRSEYLYHYNHKIIEHIENEEICERLLSFGKCEPKPENNIGDYVVKSESINEELIEEIREKGYSIDIEKKIITTFSDVYRGQLKLLLDIGDIINISQNLDFISNCIIEYIVRKRKYGYRGVGLNELIKRYYCYFSNSDWMKLFDNIVSSITISSIDDFYSVNEDIETLCLYYFKGTKPDKLSELCSNKLSTHWSWLTSCGLINLNKYELLIDEEINTLKDFSFYQLHSCFD